MRRWTALGCAVALLLGACDDEPKTAPTPTSASAPSAEPPKAPPPPWFVGRWTGTFEAKHHLIAMEKKKGGLSQWVDDDGGTATGSGSLALQVDEDRRVSGKAEGTLGALSATGVLDGDTLRVTLAPVNPKKPAAERFTGTLLAERKDADAATEHFDGSLQASSGDSLIVRTATVKLEKKPGDDGDNATSTTGTKPGAGVDTASEKR